MWLEAFWALGWTASAVIGYLVVPASAGGWRWAFALGAVPAAYALVVRWGLPESPRWLAGRGRLAEADRIVAEFERVAGVPRQVAGGSRDAGDAGVAGVTGDADANQTSRAAAGDAPRVATSGRERLGALWSPEFRVRTLSIWLVWFCVNFAYYGAFIWIPTILLDAGFPLVKSFGFTLIITLAQLPGYAVAAWLIEVWGRRATLSVFLAGSAAWGALYAVTPELYPTSLRATGAGWAAGVGRIASITAPLLVPVMLAAGGAGLAFTAFAAFFVVAAAAAWGLVDRRGLALDER